MTVGKATLEGLKSQGVVRRLEPGQVLFTKGDTPDGMYVLLSGRCSASGEDEEQHFIEPGELFGELAPLGGGHRTATVTATEASEALRIAPEEIRESDMPREVMWGWLEGCSAARPRHPGAAGRLDRGDRDPAGCAAHADAECRPDPPDRPAPAPGRPRGLHRRWRRR